MKGKKTAGLLICTIALFLAAGCGQNESSAGSRTAGNQNNVQSVLEQGMSEAAQPDETDTDIPETDDSEQINSEQINTEDEQAAAGDELSSQEPVSEPETEGITDAESEKVDLTALSSTMVYTEVYNMMTSPDNYIGKTVKMSGSYAVYHDESTDKYYHACIISDATACCSQGIEFELTDDYTYPDDYPEEGGQVCVVGTFDTYQEGDYTYCTLREAKMLDGYLPTHG